MSSDFTRLIAFSATAVLVSAHFCACSALPSSSSSSSAVSDSSQAQVVLSASSVSASAIQADYGWLSFAMPAGFVDANESESYETIVDSTDDHRIVKFSQRVLTSSYPTAAQLAESECAKDTNRYIPSSPRELGNYTWSLADFQFNGEASMKAWADISDDRALEVTFYQMNMDDPVVEEILSSIDINADLI